MLSAYRTRPARRSRDLSGYVLLGGYVGPDSWGLGAITPQQALQQAISSSGINSGTLSPSNQQLVQQAISAGQILDRAGQPAYIPGTSDCSAAQGGGVSNVQLAQVSGQMALSGINVGTSLGVAGISSIGTALGPFTLGISTLVGLFPLLFGHHAAAVKKEQSVLCSAVPAANNYLQLIDQAVQQRKITPQQAIAALQSLSSDFDQSVSSIRKMSGGSCNAACVMTEMLRGIVAYRQSQYQDLAAAAAVSSSASSGPTIAPPVSSGSTLQIPGSSTSGSPTPTVIPPPGAPAPGAAVPTPAPSPTVASTTSPSATPSWLPIAALIALGFVVTRVL